MLLNNEITVSRRKTSVNLCKFTVRCGSPVAFIKSDFWRFEVAITCLGDCGQKVIALYGIKKENSIGHWLPKPYIDQP